MFVPDRPEVLPQVAAEQGGVFTAAQAVAAGWSPRRARQLRETGRWVPVAGRGLCLAQTVPAAGFDPPTLVWAARLTWPEAVACRRTAAWLHGFPVAPGPAVQVLTRPGRRPWGRLEPHTPICPWHQAVLLRGLPVTDRTRTAVDCLALLPLPEALDLHAWLTTHRVLSREQLLRAVRERHGLAGTGQLRRILQLTRGGAVSAAEHRLHGLLHAAGITGWQPNARVMLAGGLLAVADLLFEPERVLIEVDGERAHRDRRAFVADRRRQNALTLAGYLVLRFTWWDLTGRPETVVSLITQALASREDPHRTSSLP